MIHECGIREHENGPISGSRSRQFKFCEKISQTLVNILASSDSFRPAARWDLNWGEKWGEKWLRQVVRQPKEWKCSYPLISTENLQQTVPLRTRKILRLSGESDIAFLYERRSIWCSRVEKKWLNEKNRSARRDFSFDDSRCSSLSAISDLNRSQQPREKGIKAFQQQWKWISSSELVSVLIHRERFSAHWRWPTRTGW